MYMLATLRSIWGVCYARVLPYNIVYDWLVLCTHKQHAGKLTKKRHIPIHLARATTNTTNMFHAKHAVHICVRTSQQLQNEHMFSNDIANKAHPYSRCSPDHATPPPPAAGRTHGRRRRGAPSSPHDRRGARQTSAHAITLIKFLCCAHCHVSRRCGAHGTFCG